MYDIKTEEGELKITLYNSFNKKNIVAICFFGLFAAVITLFPIFALSIFAYEKDGIPFVFVVICIISFLVAFYLFRTILWNTHGKEIIKITNNQINI